MNKTVTHIYGPNPDKYKIKLIRGQKGAVGWEISVLGATPAETIAETSKIDAQLLTLYGNKGD
jgi:hypothetical protein